MHDDITAVVDIADFQKNLSTIFETKGVLSQFKNENIPAPKKSMAVHEANKTNIRLILRKIKLAERRSTLSP